MSIGEPPPARADRVFEELILRVNDHPEARLQLLAQATEASEPGASIAAAERALLAEKVERWRYQLLNHNAGHLTEDQGELCRRIDLLMNRLSQQPPREPRALQTRLADDDDGPAWSEAEACLNTRRPLADVEAAARAATDRAFAGVDGSGRPMLLYAPLYLSNHCINHCLYCGFRYPNEMEREQLDVEQALAEAEVLGRRGFRHLLVVAGEHPRLVSVEYLAGMIAALTERGFSVGVEVAPQSTLGYRQLRQAGAISVTLYQETYDPEAYARYHPKGTKAWYDWRVEGPERAVEAGIGRIGLGILLGLGEPRQELRALIAHGTYLQERFPGLALAFSLPRIHDAPVGFAPPHRVDDDTFIRSYCSLRMAFPRATLVLSTREPPALRDRLAACCITQMSAGSSTAPGGYCDPAPSSDTLQQFPVFDQRTPDEVVAQLDRQGLRVTWDLESGHSG